MKKYHTSVKPKRAVSGISHWINYRKGTEYDPNIVNVGKGKVDKKRVMQLRYLQSKGIKSVSRKAILDHLQSIDKLKIISI